MKWRCPSCGFEQPAHPLTRRADMLPCDRYNWRTHSYCLGELPYKFDSAGNLIDPKHAPVTYKPPCPTPTKTRT